MAEKQYDNMVSQTEWRRLLFGYVRIRKPELKVKDYEIYHGFYCGLCSELKKKYGFLGQITLTYDMTFLILLLSSVYDIPAKRKQERCMMHPGKKHLRLVNEVTEYAAHLNMLLTYYHFKDDHVDEGSKKAWFGMKLYQGKKKKVAGIEEKKAELIEKILSELSELECRQTEDVYLLADCFGRLMAELFDYRQDALSKYLRELGYHMGRFIYIMDAYDDLSEDLEKGCFNPFLAKREQEDFEQMTEQMLLDEMAAAGVAFQKLPCLEYADILGNILYAGVWNRYDDIRQKKVDSVSEKK